MLQEQMRAGQGLDRGMGVGVCARALGVGYSEGGLGVGAYGQQRFSEQSDFNKCW